MCAIIILEEYPSSEQESILKRAGEELFKHCKSEGCESDMVIVKMDRDLSTVVEKIKTKGTNTLVLFGKGTRDGLVQKSGGIYFVDKDCVSELRDLIVYGVTETSLEFAEKDSSGWEEKTGCFIGFRKLHVPLHREGGSDQIITIFQCLFENFITCHIKKMCKKTLSFEDAKKFFISIKSEYKNAARKVIKENFLPPGVATSIIVNDMPEFAEEFIKNFSEENFGCVGKSLAPVQHID